MFKILVTEDEQITAKIIGRGLKNFNFQIYIANDAYSCVEMAHRIKPDLIVLDMMLPGGNGISVLQRLKVSSHTRDIPVVALTSVDDEDFKNKAIEQGISVYLAKPFNPGIMLKTISELLCIDEEFKKEVCQIA